MVVGGKKGCAGGALIKGLSIDEGRIASYSKVCSALSDPLRLRILAILKVQPLCVCVIKELVRIPDSKLSYHLGVLRSADLVESERDGTWIIYSLTKLGREHARSFSPR
jgi:ArsR family transcriptional regulator